MSDVAESHRLFNNHLELLVNEFEAAGVHSVEHRVVRVAVQRRQWLHVIDCDALEDELLPCVIAITVAVIAVTTRWCLIRLPKRRKVPLDQLDRNCRKLQLTVIVTAISAAQRHLELQLRVHLVVDD